MSWTEQLFRYCERGADPAFWAEPLNALTNICFLLTTALAWRLYRCNLPSPERRVAVAFLITLVAVIAVGSFLFHTTAARWAAVADLAPIGIFMLAYFAFALSAFLDFDWCQSALGLAMFVVLLMLASEVSCAPPFMPVSNALGLECFNGTVGYAPAWLAMLAIGGALRYRRHPAAPLLLAAAAIFLVSMAFRAFDFEICADLLVHDHRIGTHFIWHVLNAAVLYLLLRAAILHGTPAIVRRMP